MRRRTRAFAGALLKTIAAAAVLAGCGGSSSNQGLTFSPQHPHPSSNVTFSFTAPTRAGIVGKVIDSYSLSVTGPAGENCKGSDERAGSPVAQGAHAPISAG